MASKANWTELQPAPDVNSKIFSTLDPVHQLKIEHYIKKVDEKKREKLALVLGVTKAELVEWHGTRTLLRQRFPSFVSSKFIQTGNASWATFVTALRHEDVNATKLADEIATKHYAKQSAMKRILPLKSHEKQTPPARLDSTETDSQSNQLVTELRPAFNVVDRKFLIVDPVHQLKIENHIKKVEETRRERLAIVLGVTEAELKEWQGTRKILRPRFSYFITTKFIQTGNASWATFVAALRHPNVNETKMADEIASKHSVLKKRASSTKDSRLDFDVNGVKKIPRASLTLESVQVDGGGIFGDWYRGTVVNEGGIDSGHISLIPVSIKESTVQLEKKERFIYEGRLMSKLRHDNVVKLLGVCVDDVPLCFVTEFISDRNLHLFLRRANYQKEIPATLSISNKVQIALDVAEGCQYLQEKQIIHRNISARSCFVVRNDLSNEDDEQFTVKIGEFGSASDLTISSHDSEQCMLLDKNPELTMIKWCAPEAFLEGSKALTLESDIWSYGILLYEIVTLCKAPYPGLSNKDVVEFVSSGKRMAKPDGCNNSLYELMQACWQISPSKRLPFVETVQRLSDISSSLNSTSVRDASAESRLTQVAKPQLLQSMSLPATEISATINKQKRKIEAQLMLAENRKSQGIIYIVGIYGADGTEIDVQNTETTFKELNFTTFVERNPSGEDIANLVQAAAEVKYPYRYKYVAFYFAGHGGIDEDEKNFIMGLQLGDGDGSEIVYVDEYIVNPLKCLHEKKISRLFFFDCCQSKNEGNTFRAASLGTKKKPKPHPGEIVAYATNQGEKSWGDKTNGGIWTYCLCKNLRELYEPISTILSKTYDDVAIARNSDQQPRMVCSLGVRYLKEPPVSEVDSNGIGQKTTPKEIIVDEDSAATKKPLETQTQQNLNPVIAKDVCKCLEGAAYYWGDIAHDLSIDEGYRESLFENVSETDEEKLEEIIERWIGKKTCEVSWEKIATVAKDLELDEVAKRLEKASKMSSNPIVWDGVYNCLRRKAATSWNAIAVHLEISPAFISELDEQNPSTGTDRRKLEKVIKEWLDESKGYEPTWEKIIKAVKELGLTEEAHALELLSNSS